MNSILSEQDLSLWHQLISDASHIVISVHTNPDGDAIGSALAIQHFLQRKGKDAHIVVPNLFPDFLQWMPGATEICCFASQREQAKEWLEQADLVIIADLNQPSRLMDLEETILQSKAPRIMIDHHLEPADFCSLVVSEPEMCATAEVWCHILSQLGEMECLTTDEATCIYTAMMCDTGAFSYNSSRPEIYTFIGQLLATGIDKDDIYRKIFYSASTARMRLMGYMLYVKMETIDHLHTSILTLTNKERKLFNTKNGDTEGFVNLPLQIKGTKLSIFLSEDTQRPNTIKVSLRSVGDFPCNELSAKFFQGGGHRNASGGSVKGTMDEALKLVHEALECYKELLKNE